VPWQIVHTFTSLGGITYTLQVDYTTGQVQTTWDPSTSTPEATLTEGEIGFVDGGDIAFICEGNTKKLVRAILDFPFLEYIEYTPNRDCGWVPPVCTWLFTSAIINSTNGSNNGRISVAVDLNGNPPGTLTFQYSLDGLSWQTSPVFNFLFPGIYQVYVRDQEGCMKTALVTVANDLDSGLVPTTIPWEQSNRMCFFFRLVIDGVSHNVREPLKWDGVEIIGERDQEFHGYMFKHTDGNVSLGFDCPAGKELIEEVYNDKGQDGEIQFHYGYSFGGSDYFLFRGKLMLNTYKWFPGRVECTVETEDLDTAFQSRIDTPVSMIQDKSFDNQNVPVPNPYSLQLHAKQIFTRFVSSNSGVQAVSNSYSQGARNFYVKPDNTNPTYADLRDNYQYPLGGQTSKPDDVSEYLTKFFVGGVANIDIDINMDIGMKRSNVNDDPDYHAWIWIVKKKYDIGAGAIVTTAIDITTTPIVGQFNNNGYGYFNIAGTYQSLNENFSPGDEIYLYINIYCDRENRVKFEILHQHTGDISIEYVETSVSTPAKGWFLEDVIRHCINVTGNNTYAFRSTFIERMNSNQLADGCGWRSRSRRADCWDSGPVT
jgi:hypothetical protein